MTLYFCVDVEVGLARTKNRDDNNRMDQESLDFYKNVKRGYDDLSRENTERIKVIDASDTYENVQKTSTCYIGRIFKQWTLVKIQL